MGEKRVPVAVNPGAAGGVGIDGLIAVQGVLSEPCEVEIEAQDDRRDEEGGL